MSVIRAPELQYYWIMQSNDLKRLLVVSSNFWPEASGIAIYTTDLATSVFLDTCEITVLTSIPHYQWYVKKEVPTALNLSEANFRPARIIRIPLKISTQRNVISRALIEYSFWRNSRKALLEFDSVIFDAVIAIMPTVASGLVARRIAKRKKIPGLVIFQDLSGVGALQSGLPGAKALVAITKFLEARASTWATQIAVISPAMITPVKRLTRNKIPIEVLYNYTVTEFPHIEQGAAREQFSFPKNDFIVMHTGNIGYKQDLLNVIRSAKLLTGEPDIKIYIVGHGNQEEEVRTATNGMNNISLMASVPLEQYPALLAAADLLLINERPSQMEMSLPSKLTSYLAANRPVIAAVPIGGATHRYLEGLAEIVPAGDPQALANGMIASQ